MNKRKFSTSIQIIAWYVLIGGLWILLSDKLAARLFPDPTLLSVVQTYKGWFFVLITALLLYGLINKSLKKQLMSEKSYLDVVEYAEEGIFRSSPNGRFTFVNPAMAKIYGYASPEEMLELVTDIGVQIHVSKETRQKFTDELNRLGSVQKYTAMNLKKDGSSIWTATNARVVKNAKGEIDYYEGFVRDITAEKIAEDTVKFNEIRYHMLVEQASDGIFIVDASGKILESNQQACKITGYSSGELIAMSLNQLMSEDELVLRPLRLHDLSHGRFISNERTLKRKDSSFLTIELNLKKLPDENLMAVARDISTRKLMQETILRRERRFRTLMENSMDAIILYGPDGKVAFQNPASTRILGYQQEDVIGQSLFKFVYEEDMEKANKGLQSILEEAGTSQTFEIRCVPKDGGIRWLEIIGTSKLDDPEIEAVIINFRDVTARKQAEGDLKNAEERYRILVEKLPAVVFMDNFTDAEKTQYMSPRMKDLLGYTPEEWESGNRMWENSLHPDDKERVLAEDIHTDKTGEPFHIEYRLRHKEGHYVWVREEATLLHDENGNPLYWHGIMLDITERKNYEEALQRQLKELTILHSVSLAESISLTMDELIQRVTDTIGDTLYSDNCGVFLLNAEGNSLTPHSSYRGASGENVNITLPLGMGITGKAAFTRKTQRCGNVSTDPNYFQLTEGIKSEVCVPIIAGDNLYGVLNIESMRENAFTEDDERLLTTIAGGMATSMERLQLFGLEQRRLKREETIREATAMLTSSIEPDKVYEIILESTHKLVPYTSASIELVNNNVVEIVAGKGLPQHLVGTKYPFEPRKQSTNIWEPVIISDVQKSSNFTKLKGTEYIHGWLGVPLIIENVIVGFINLDSNEPNYFTDEDAATIRLFGNQAAIAIEKARLFQVEQKRRLEAENLRFAAAALTSTLEIENILQEVIKALRQVAPYDSASILLQEDEWLKVAITQNQVNKDALLEMTFSISGDELFQKIKATRQPLILEDVANDPRFRNWGQGEGIKSWMGIPLISQGEVIGCITLDSKESETYDANIGDQAMSFGYQAAIAIENARLYTETRSRLVELEMVSRVSSVLRAARETKEMFPILLKEIKSAANTDTAALWTYDADSNMLIPQASSGWLSELPKSNFRPGEGIVGKVFTNNELHISLEFSKDPDGYPANTEAIKSGWGGIIVPIRSTSETIGVMAVAIQTPRKIETNHVRLISTIAEIAGNAIYRSKLYERSEEQIRRLTTLREIDAAITSSLDLHITLGILIEHITTKMGVSAAAILVFNTESQMLDYYSTVGFQTRDFARTSLGIGDGLAGRILLTRRAVYIKDLAQEPGLRRVGALSEKFTSYYAIPLFSKGVTRGILETYFKEPFSPTSDWLDFLHMLAEQATIAIDNAHLFENLQRTNQDLSLAYDTTLEGWGKALELRDKETEGHTRRVTDLTLELARQMGISDTELVNIRRGTLLHDIGKMGVPDQILRKAGPLTEEEKTEMRKHPQYARDLLYPITYLRPAIDIAYCHHEWWNGEGYPRGIKGEDIPLSARIFAIVDVWDALRSDRPYRKAWSKAKTLKYIRDLSGKQFDPHVVEAFTALLEKIGEMETQKKRQ